LINGTSVSAMGYKYNKRKVLNFIWTTGAGHTEPTGTLYEAV